MSIIPTPVIAKQRDECNRSRLVHDPTIKYNDIMTDDAIAALLEHAKRLEYYADSARKGGRMTAAADYMRQVRELESKVVKLKADMEAAAKVADAPRTSISVKSVSNSKITLTDSPTTSAQNYVRNVTDVLNVPSKPKKFT